MNARVVFALVGMLVGLAAGWLLGGRRAIPGEPIPTQAAPSRAATAPPLPTSRPPAAATSALVGLALESALRTAAAEPDDELRREQLRALAARIELAAVSDVLAKAARILRPGDLTAFRTRLLELLAAQNPLAALALAQAALPPQERGALQSAVLQVWARRDAAALVQWFKALPDADRRQQHQALATALGLYAPKAGLALLQELAPGSDRQEFQSQFFYQWSRRDAAAAYREGSGMLLGQGQQFVVGMVLSEWLQQDFPAALQALEGLEPRGKNWQVWENCFHQVAQQRPETAAQLWAKVPGQQRQQQLLGAFLMIWAQRDASAARAWVDALNPPGLRQNAQSMLMVGLLETDPTQALAWFKEHKPGPQDGWIYRNAVQKLAQTDPAAALELLGQITHPNVRQDALSGLMETWAGSDPQAAAKYATQLPVGANRQQALAQLVNGWAQHDLAGAVAFARTLTSPHDLAGVSQQLAWKLGQEEPAVGRQWLESMPVGAARNQFLQGFAGAWMQQDPEATKQWIESLSDAGLRKQALRAVSDSWAQHDPQGAAKYALTLTDPALQRDFITSALNSWTPTDPEAALAWANQLAAGPMRNAALQTLALSRAESDPVAAAELAVQIPDERLQHSALLNVVQNWATQDPQTAAAWVAQFPAGELRNEAEQQLVQNWASQDPVGAATWLQELPAGEGRDRAAESLATNLRDVDPATAGAWVDSITDKDRRQSAVQEHLSWWWQNDPDAARDWLNSLNESEEAKAAWLKAAQDTQESPDDPGVFVPTPVDVPVPDVVPDQN